MEKLKGYIVPIFTIFNKDGSIDEEGMRSNISYLIKEGIHGIAIAGSNGEFPLLTFEEKVRLFKIGVDEAANRCKIIAGTTEVSTEATIRLSQAAEKAGVDHLMILAPYFIMPTERDIINHFQQISKKTSLPIMVYNNPGKSAVSLGPNLINELSKIDNVVTVKQSSSNFFELLEIIRITKGRNDFYVIGGREIWAFPSFVVGAEAVFGISPLILGRECIEMYECAKKGDIKRGMTIQYKVNLLRSVTFQMNARATIPALFKEIMNIKGMAGGYLRAPIMEVTDSDKKQLRQLLNDVNNIHIDS